MATTKNTTKKVAPKTETKKKISKVMQGIMKIQGAFDREEVIRYGHS